MKLSIIVPVYNVEKYLRECVDSIEAISDVEVLLINDGSTDNSGAICDEIASERNDVKVFHKSNGGLSDARNYGIKKAIGDYITFADSDDFYETGATRKILNALISDKDMYITNLSKYYSSDDIVYDKSCKEIYANSHEDLLNKLTGINSLPVSACTKIIKRCIILDNNLFFKENILCEDIQWFADILMSQKINSVEYLDLNYFYRQSRVGSITSAVNDKHITDTINIIEPVFESDCDERIKIIMSYELMILVFNFKRGSKTLQVKTKKVIKKYMHLMKKLGNKKARLVYLSCKLIGIKFTNYLVNKVYH